MAEILAILGSFLVWFDVYSLLQVINYNHTPEWNCRTITAIHAVIITFLGFLSAFIFGPWPFNYIAQESNNLHTAIVFISIGYFFFDFSWCIYMQTEAPVMLAHHLVSIFGLCYVLYTGKYGCDISAALGASEATNPLLQLRWFMKNMGNYTGRKAAVIDWTFVTLFIVLRLGLGTAFLFAFLSSPDVDWIASVGVCVFYLISFIFGVQLLLYVHRKYFMKRSKNQANGDDL